MTARDEHLDVLNAIWGEMKALNGKIDNTNDRLTQLDRGVAGVRSGLDEANERLGLLEQRHIEAEVRVSTELVAVASAVREVRDVVREQGLDRRRLDRLESRVEALEKKSA